MSEVDVFRAVWRKSTLSHTNGCVEVTFEKSVNSNANGCVEIARRSAHSGGSGCVDIITDSSGCVEEGPGHFGAKDGEPVTVLVRDSKDPDGPRLRFTAHEWKAFLGGVRDGEFDA